MRLVVDSSVATAWCSHSQASPLSEAALDVVAEFGATVPPHFQMEVANSLLQLERRNRIERASVDEFLARLETMDMEIDSLSASAAFSSVLPVARRYGLTLYDAAYLELALRARLPLASRDDALIEAAGRAGAPLFAP
jgi:predicted nucleic acid-binding protein